MATEKLHFRIQSAQYVVRLATTILLEQDEEELDRIGYAWHEVLDTASGEELFLDFMEEVLPIGGTIGENELLKIKEKAINFLDTNETALEIQAEYDKIRYDSWVYFKPYHKVYTVDFANHYTKVKEILIEYFKGIDDYDINKFNRFMKENFEIRSTVSTIDTIIKDSRSLLLSVILAK